MTIRNATKRESPDGVVLYIEELRNHLGIGAGTGKSSSSSDATGTQPEVIIIGHNMNGDFQKMRKDGIDLQKHFHYSGCIDTQVVVEDTAAMMGQSLSALVSNYGLAEIEWKKPLCPSIAAKPVFVGQHCAGNDAVATLKVVIRQAFDRALQTAAHSDPIEEKSLPENWFEKPLPGMNLNMILIAYDTEGVETLNYKPHVPNRTSEHGFAWVRLADLAHIAPGEHGEGWLDLIQARHWINHDFRTFSNRYFCISNPNGFWPEYGKSEYYHVSDGPAPFHRLFEQLARPIVGIRPKRRRKRKYRGSGARDRGQGSSGDNGGSGAPVEEEAPGDKGVDPVRGESEALEGVDPLEDRDLALSQTNVGHRTADRSITINSVASGSSNRGQNPGNGRTWAQVARGTL